MEFEDIPIYRHGDPLLFEGILTDHHDFQQTSHMKYLIKYAG